MDDDDTASLLKLLANPTNRAILERLAEAPSYPRALAARLGGTEGDVQRKLHRLEDAGLVRGAWSRRDGRVTVKEYALVARGVRVELERGAPHAAVERVSPSGEPARPDPWPIGP